MRTPRLLLSDAAIADILEQAEWYAEQADSTLATRWERAVTRTVLRAFEAPRTGAPCTFQAPELYDVRKMAITGFPRHLMFYRLREGEFEILRVVHGTRDLERLFT